MDGPTNADELLSLKSRVYALEHHVNGWKRAGGVLAVLTFAVFCLGWRAREDVPDFLYARRGFLVKDEAGKTRVFMGIRKDGSVGLDVMDDQGRVRDFARIPAEEGGQIGFGVQDEGGSVREFLGKSSGYYAAATLDDDDDPLVVVGEVGPESWGTAVFDEDARPRIHLGRGKQDDRRGLGMLILNEQGKGVIGFGGLDGGGSVIKVSDARGVERVGLGLTPNGLPFMRLKGRDGMERLLLQVGAKNTVTFRVKDGDRKPVDVMPAVLKEVEAAAPEGK